MVLALHKAPVGLGVPPTGLKFWGFICGAAVPLGWEVRVIEYVRRA